MNPFEWRGPEFLLFYAVFAAVLCITLHLLRRISESGQPEEPGVPLRDPYTIAYLRGGKNEAIRLAAVALIERGLLERREKNELVTTDRAAARLGGDPLEQEVLRFFQTRRQAPDAFKMNSGNWKKALEPRQQTLERAGLMPDALRRSFRNWLVLAGVFLLGLVSTLKIWVGITRGRPVTLLVLFTIFALILLICVLYSYPRTRRGNAALADIREIFGGLKTASPSGMGDLVMLGAVFGITALPVAAMPYIPDLYPQAAKGGGGDGSGCGSSCGSSCGGGGGCGGGGCGGCGS